MCFFLYLFAYVLHERRLVANNSCIKVPVIAITIKLNTSKELLTVVVALSSTGFQHNTFVLASAAFQHLAKRSHNQQLVHYYLRVRDLPSQHHQPRCTQFLRHNHHHHHHRPRYHPTTQYSQKLSYEAYGLAQLLAYM
uniref:Uncharacterized protein n=1 Tax=Glossina austeni TaxID=7395 RepID=A0A1A9V4R0_GLOAU